MNLLWISGWAFAPPAWKPVFDHAPDSWNVHVLDPLDVLHDPTRIESAARPLDSFVLGGWSLGAMLALEFAGSLQKGPQGLALLSGTASFCQRPDFLHGLPTANIRALRAAIRRDRDTGLASFYELVGRPHHGARSWPSPATDRPAESLWVGLDYLMKTDLRNAVDRIRIPVALVHGKEDAVVPAEAGEDLANRLPHSTFVLVEGAGHDVPFVATGQLLDSISRIADSS